MGGVLGKVATLAVSIAVPLGGGVAVGLWTAPEVKTWYKKIKKPTWNPPNWIFGPVWTVLYISQGIASWLVLQKGFHGNVVPLSLYAAQLLVNFAWNPLFFKAHRVDLALADIVTLDALVVATFGQFKDVIGLPATAGLLGPYIAWISFATVLNGWILANNKPGSSESAPLLDEVAGALSSAQETVEKAAAEVKEAVENTTEATVEKAEAAAAKAEEAVQEAVQEAEDAVKTE